MYKTLLSTVIVFALSAPIVLAQNDSLARVKKAAQLFELMGMSDTFDKVFDSVFDMQETEYKTKLPAETRKVILDEMILMMQKVVVPVFAKYYDEKEMDEMLVFYNSPVGKKSVRVLPDMTIDLQKGVIKWMETELPIFQKKIEEASRRTGKRLH